MELHEILWFIYGGIGFTVFWFELITLNEVWEAMARGIIWPIFPIVAIIKILRNL